VVKTPDGGEGPGDGRKREELLNNGQEEKRRKPGDDMKRFKKKKKNKVVRPRGPKSWRTYAFFARSLFPSGSTQKESKRVWSLGGTNH